MLLHHNNSHWNKNKTLVSLCCVISFGASAVYASPNLTTSAQHLALSVKNTALNATLTGKPRVIHIRNNGSSPAYDVKYTIYPPLPSGTNITPKACGTMPAGATCLLTISPGINPSAAPGVLFTPSVIAVSGENTNSVTSQVSVLTYGSIYQAGFVFAIDDATSSSESIKGKVAALKDTVSPNTGIRWGSVVIDVSPMPPYVTWDTNTQGIHNGHDNSAIILEILSLYNSIPMKEYAAGRCQLYAVDDSGMACSSGSMGCYNDWYLPAICELAPFANATSAHCKRGTNNIQQQLFNAYPPIPNLKLQANSFYWSSTESSYLPGPKAWTERFGNEQSTQQTDNKTAPWGVRCVRALT